MYTYYIIIIGISRFLGWVISVDKSSERIEYEQRPPNNLNLGIFPLILYDSTGINNNYALYL